MRDARLRAVSSCPWGNRPCTRLSSSSTSPEGGITFTGALRIVRRAGGDALPTTVSWSGPSCLSGPKALSPWSLLSWRGLSRRRGSRPSRAEGLRGAPQEGISPRGGGPPQAPRPPGPVKELLLGALGEGVRTISPRERRVRLLRSFLMAPGAAVPGMEVHRHEVDVRRRDAGDPSRLSEGSAGRQELLAALRQEAGDVMVVQTSGRRRSSSFLIRATWRCCRRMYPSYFTATSRRACLPRRGDGPGETAPPQCRIHGAAGGSPLPYGS